MLFYSLEFIYLFFPITLAGYFLLGKNSKHLGVIWLVICSLFFYGWWNPRYVPFLMGSLVCNYYYGLMLRGSKNRLLLYGGLILNLSLIGYYKYAGFFSTIINETTGSAVNFGEIVLPLGISFFTFQQISWLVDCHKDKFTTRDKGLWEYGLFVTFFPQLIAGPIVHHAEMMPQFHEKQNRLVNWGNMAAGITIFIIGMAKKIIIADSISPYANKVFAASLTSKVITAGEAWAGALAYTLQLYFDFSGYADMAIGLALMCNIHLPINFDSPYKAISITDFWRRWHITLSRFLRDYVYFPLGGSKAGEQRRYINLLLTMLIGGLWHGAGWTFVLWGGLHGVFLVIHRLWINYTTLSLPKIMAQATTFICLVAAWVLFRAENLESALRIFTAMSNLQTMTTGQILSSKEMTRALSCILPALFIVFLLPNTQNLIGDARGGIAVYQNSAAGWSIPLPRYQTSTVWLSSVAVLALTTLYFLIDQGKIHEFIYFQF